MVNYTVKHRQKLTDLFLEELVKEVIREKGIQSINYQDLQKFKL